MRGGLICRGCIMRTLWSLHALYCFVSILCLCRFGHCSAQLCSGEILVTGGFGCVNGYGPHTRLNDVVLLKPVTDGTRDGKWECLRLEPTGQEPGM